VTIAVAAELAIGVAGVLGHAVAPAGDGGEVGIAEPAAEQPEMNRAARNSAPARDITEPPCLPPPPGAELRPGERVRS
jgi:hypothetical protein